MGNVIIFIHGGDSVILEVATLNQLTHLMTAEKKVGFLLVAFCVVLGGEVFIICWEFWQGI